MHDISRPRLWLKEIVTWPSLRPKYNSISIGGDSDDCPAKWKQILRYNISQLNFWIKNYLAILLFFCTHLCAEVLLFHDYLCTPDLFVLNLILKLCTLVYNTNKIYCFILCYAFKSLHYVFNLFFVARISVTCFKSFQFKLKGKGFLITMYAFWVRTK